MNARGTAIKIVQIVVNETITILLTNICIVFLRESIETKSSIGTVIAVITNQIEGIRIKPAMIEDTTMENKTTLGYFFTPNL